MKKMIVVSMVACLSLFANEASAKSLKVSLEDGVKTVLTENPELQSTIFTYLQVAKDLNIAKNAFYPTVDLYGNYGYEKQSVDDSKNKVHGDGQKAGFGVILNQNIYNGNADENRIYSQSHRMNAAAYSVTQKADRLALQFVDAYINALKHKDLLDIEEKNVETHLTIAKQITDRANSGFGKQSEVRQANSRLTLAQSNLVAQRNNYYDALTTLSKIYGSPLTATNLTIPKFKHMLPQTESELATRALECNPTILLQENNIKMAESVSKEKDAPFRPKLDLEISAGHELDNVFQDKRRSNTFSVMLKGKYNIYNKNQDVLEKEKSRLAVNEVSQQLSSVKRDLEESLKFSWQTYKLGKEKEVHLTKHVGYAKETLDSYRDEFKIGRRDLINLLDAESEYNNAIKELTETRYSILYAQYRMLDNMGQISDTFVPNFTSNYIIDKCNNPNQTTQK